MDIYAVWVEYEYQFLVVMNDKMKDMMLMMSIISVAGIVCLTTMRNRTTSTQTGAGTLAPTPAAKAKSKAKARAKVASKAEAKAQPKSRPRTATTQTEDWLGDAGLLDPEPDDVIEDVTEDDADGGRTSAASSSTEVPRTTARVKATPKKPVATLVECSRMQHPLKVGRNSHSVYVTCETCRHHAVWLKQSTGPGPEIVFDTVTNLILHRAWTSLTEQ